MKKTALIMLCMVLLISLVILIMYCHKGEPSENPIPVYHPSVVKVEIHGADVLFPADGTSTPNILTSTLVGGIAYSHVSGNLEAIDIHTVKIKVDQERYNDNVACTIIGDQNVVPLKILIETFEGSIDPTTSEEVPGILDKFDTNDPEQVAYRDYLASLYAINADGYYHLIDPANATGGNAANIVNMFSIVGYKFFQWECTLEPSLYCRHTHILTAKAWDSIGSESESDTSVQFVVQPQQNIAITLIDGLTPTNGMILNSISSIEIQGTSIALSPRDYGWNCLSGSVQRPVYLWIDSTSSIYYCEGTNNWSITLDPLNLPGVHEICAVYTDNCCDKITNQEVACFTVTFGSGNCDFDIQFTSPTNDAQNLCDIDLPTELTAMNASVFEGPIYENTIQGTAYAGAECKIHTIELQIDTGSWQDCTGSATNLAPIVGSISEWVNVNDIHTCFYQSYVDSLTIYPTSTCPGNTFLHDSGVPLFGYPHILRVRVISTDSDGNYSWSTATRLVYFRNYIDIDILQPYAGQQLEGLFINLVGTASGSYFVTNSIFDDSTCAGTNCYKWTYCIDTTDPYDTTNCSDSWFPYQDNQVTEAGWSEPWYYGAITGGTHIITFFYTDYCGMTYWMEQKYINVVK